MIEPAFSLIGHPFGLIGHAFGLIRPGARGHVGRRLVLSAPLSHVPDQCFSQNGDAVPLCQPAAPPMVRRPTCG